MVQKGLGNLAVHDEGQQAAGRLKEQVVVFCQQECHELLLQVILNNLSLRVHLRQLIVPGLGLIATFTRLKQALAISAIVATAWIKAGDHHRSNVIVTILIIIACRLWIIMRLFK